MTRFPVKYDWWVHLLMFGLLLMPLPIFLDVGWRSTVAISIAVGNTAIILPLMWLIYSIRYELDATDFTIRLGPFVTRIPVSSITDVRHSRNPLSAPAPSLKRVRIDSSELKFGFALVAAEDNDLLIATLRSAAGLPTDDFER